MNKSHKKRLLVLMSSLILVFFLTGCSSDILSSPVTENSTGIWDHYVVWNFIRVIEFLSDLLGHSYGWGIVAFTIIVRIIILPLMIYQMKSMRKTSDLQPQLKALQAKYPGKDRESREKMMAEQQKLYSEAGVNPVAGCLPLIIQMPILYALYQAIYRSPVLKTGHFLWTELGSTDPYYILPILAALFTFLTTKLSMMSQAESNIMTRSMTYVMPLMIFFMAIKFPAALGLYWVVTNAFSVGQTLMINNPYKIRRERAEKVNAQKTRERKLAKAKKRAYKTKKN